MKLLEWNCAWSKYVQMRWVGSGSGLILVIEQGDTFRLVLVRGMTVLYTCIKLVYMVCCLLDAVYGY